MDPFDEERPELSGSLVSIEFGPGGRIQQLWASDPGLPEEGEDFQFVLPPLQFGEESADDYLPGTILIGARTNPDDHWVVSRNGQAKQILDIDSDTFDPTKVAYEYTFPFLDDIKATGKFYEVADAVPQICWDLEIKNAGRISIEIGELGFPLAFNNLYEGFGWSDEQLKKLWQSRVYIHKFIGGAASWLFAQRMTAETPGLLVFPGEGTSWEFYNHVRSSLNTPYQWEGIPVVYAHSKATIEREEWSTWFNEHSSLILEPGDSRTFQMRFVPTESDKQDGLNATLAACGRPTIRLLPSAVAPMDVGIGVEVTGVAPKRFWVSRAAETEVDTDEEGGFCFVRPTEPGPITVSFRDNSDKMCHAHLMVTEPIRNLIKKRAAWIAKNQIVDDPTSPLHHAVVLTNIVNSEQVTSEEEYQESSGLECAMADALFLAEKNAVYPDRDEIKALDAFVRDFLQDDVQNPGDYAVGSVLSATGGSSYFGRPLNYPHVFNLYHSMFRVASTYGETEKRPEEYLRAALLTALAMFQHGWRLYVRTVGVLGFARIYDLLDDLRANGMEAEAEELQACVDFKGKELMKQKYPYAGETVMDTSGFEEVFAAARYLADDDHLERTARCAFAARSLSPSWWWYGSDKRCWDGGDSTPLKALVDRGEACLSQTVIPNSLIFFGMMDRDYLALPDAYMRMAFGGMLGPWALIRHDGAASMCYCPDHSSQQAGFNAFTGAGGLGYYHYLRGTGAYVLPNREQGVYTFGCHYGLVDAVHTVAPWDGVGRRVILRQIGAEFHLGFGCFDEVRLDERKRWFEATVDNPSDKHVNAELRIRGLWGAEVEIEGQRVKARDGWAVATVSLPAGTKTTVKGKVVS